MQKKNKITITKIKKDKIPKEERKRLIEKDLDFIDCPKFENSLEILLSRPQYADGVEDSQASKFLHMTEEEYAETAKLAVFELRKKLVNNG